MSTEQEASALDSYFLLTQYGHWEYDVLEKEYRLWVPRRLRDRKPVDEHIAARLPREEFEMRGYKSYCEVMDSVFQPLVNRIHSLDGAVLTVMFTMDINPEQFALPDTPQDHLHTPIMIN